MSQEAIFVNDKPARITPDDFLRYHLQSFTALGDASRRGIIEEAIDTVYAMFTGLETLWSFNDRQTWYDKTFTVFRLLTAWYIVDQYPRYTNGVPGTGGLPIKRKKIGPVDITFNTGTFLPYKGYIDMLQPLRSNNFGNKAYMMIIAAAKRARLGVQAKV